MEHERKWEMDVRKKRRKNEDVRGREKHQRREIVEDKRREEAEGEEGRDGEERRGRERKDSYCWSEEKRGVRGGEEGE